MLVALSPVSYHLQISASSFSPLVLATTCLPVPQRELLCFVFYFFSNEHKNLQRSLFTLACFSSNFTPPPPPVSTKPFRLSFQTAKLHYSSLSALQPPFDPILSACVQITDPQRRPGPVPTNPARLNRQRPRSLQAHQARPDHQ